jgi:large subunit ribosomal protein L30e
MDLGRALKVAVDTGTVRFGVKQARKALGDERAVLLVLSRGCPDEDRFRSSGVRVLPFPGGSMELGAACGKPFGVSVVTILDPGDSPIGSA